MEKYNAGTQNDALFERSNSKAFVLFVHATRLRDQTFCEIRVAK